MGPPEPARYPPLCAACAKEVVRLDGRAAYWRERWFCDVRCLERYRRMAAAASGLFTAEGDASP